MQRGRIMTLMSDRLTIEQRVKESDVIIGTVLIPGARAPKLVTDEMVAWKTEGTRLYQALPAELHATLKPCEPLREVPADRPPITVRYATWKERSGE